MNLYELTGQYRDLLDMAADGTTEELEQMLDGLEGKIEEKLENTAKVIKSLEVDAGAYEHEIKRMQQRKSAIESNIKRLKDSMLDNMTTLGIAKVKGTTLSVSLQKNPPKVVVQDEFYVPEKYWYTPEPQRQVDKKAIAAAVKNGETVPGVEVVQDQRITIK